MTTKEGQKRSDLELDVMRVQFLEAMGEGGEVEAGEEPVEAGVPVAAAAPSYGTPAKAAAPSNNDEDEVPF